MVERKQPAKDGRPNYQVRALERGLDILEVFSLKTPELSLADIATTAHLAKSTALRLLSVLEERGYIERSAQTDAYRLGVRAFEAGSVYIQSMKLEAEARPFLDRLVQACGHTANLGVLDRGAVVHLAVVAPNRPIRFFSPVGEREMIHCTGLGKALLATLDEEQLAQFLREQKLERRTSRTITNPDVLRMELDRVRDRGYAMDDEESYVGLRCISAPVRNDKDHVVAAVSISGPSAEFTDEVLPKYIDAVLKAANSISARLGYRVQYKMTDATPESDDLHELPRS